MNAPHLRRAGFTLIELLTVIAIIGILTAFTAAVLPNILEKARISNTVNVANQLRILLTAYYADHGTYPPAYGYIKPDEFGTQGILLEQNPPNDFVTIPWMAALGVHEVLDLYDPFSTEVDVNTDNTIEMLEYSPVGGHKAADYAAGEVEQGFFTRVYNATADAILDIDVNLQFTEEKRPFIYIPINKRQYKRMKEGWPGGNDPRPDDGTAVNNDFADLRFPPPSYDAYVLISLGPYRNYPSTEPLFGLLYDSVPAGFSFIDLANAAYPVAVNAEGTEVRQLYRYHYMAMATYYMATRDADENGKLDFDFLTRKNEDEAAGNRNRFDDPDFSNIGGPLIFLSP